MKLHTGHLGNLWAIDPKAFSCLEGCEEGDRMRAEGTPLFVPKDGSRFLARRGDVALLRVSDVIYPRADFITDYYDIVTAEGIAEAAKAACADPSVKAFVLVMDSPGGVVTGVDETSVALRNLRAVKPVVCYVEGCCCSAAFWIASGCSRIVASPTAEIGSVGALMSFSDNTEMLKKLGIERFDLVSSESPNKRLDPKSEKGKEAYLRLLDQTVGIFAATLAANRGTSESEVFEKYGRGLTFLAADAKARGMVDAVGTLDDLLEELNQGEEMEDEKETVAAPQAAEPAPEETPELAQAVSDQPAVDAAAEAARSAVEAERARVAKLTALCPPGAEALRDKFVAEGTAVESALEAFLEFAVKNRPADTWSERAAAESAGLPGAPKPVDGAVRAEGKDLFNRVAAASGRKGA